MTDNSGAPLYHTLDMGDVLPDRARHVQGQNTQGVHTLLCLACLTSVSGSLSMVNFANMVHESECYASLDIAYARHDLLMAIRDVSQSVYMAGWLAGIEVELLARGGMWRILADQIGWPVGYLGLDGWDINYKAALARYPDLETTSTTGQTHG